MIFITRPNRAPHMCCNTIRLFSHTWSSSSSQVVRMHHPMRVAIRTDMIATKIRVGAFEILKQKSNSAMKKIPILSTKEEFHKREPSAISREARNDARPHKQPPRKAENNGHRFKTEDSVKTMKEIRRLLICYLSAHIKCDCSLTAPEGSSFSLVRL